MEQPPTTGLAHPEPQDHDSPWLEPTTSDVKVNPSGIALSPGSGDCDRMAHLRPRPRPAPSGDR